MNTDELKNNAGSQCIPGVMIQFSLNVARELWGVAVAYWSASCLRSVEAQMKPGLILAVLVGTRWALCVFRQGAVDLLKAIDTQVPQ